MKDKIKDRMRECMKNKEVFERDLLRVVLGEIQKEDLREGNITDERCLKIIKKMRDNNLETIKLLGDKIEKIKILEDENNILDKFIPKSLSIEEIINALSPLKENILGIKQGPAIGMAVGFLKKQELAAEGKDVAEAVGRMKE